MRIQSGSLGVFVPGQWTVPQMPVLGTDWPPVGGSGVGDFVAGKFAVPQNPILDAGSGMGDIVGTEALYPLQPNSVMAAFGLSGLGAGGDCGCGCQGHGGCGGGLAAFSMSDVNTFVSAQWAKIQAGDVQTIALWAGGAVLALIVLGGMSAGGGRRRR